jgi:hypothetical protein
MFPRLLPRPVVFTRRSLFLLLLIVSGCTFRSFGPTEFTGRWQVRTPWKHREFVELLPDSSFRQYIEESPDYFTEADGRWTLRPGTRQVILLNGALFCDSAGHYGHFPTRRMNVPILVTRHWFQTILIYDAKGYGP